MQYSAGQIARIVHGEVVGNGDLRPIGVEHDSRRVRPGQLFVALSGQRTDGHQHLGEAFAKGASCALVRDPGRLPNDVKSAVVVPDPLQALQCLAADWRGRLSAPIVGITGSHGKTTTRALLAHLLSARHQVFETPENYNSDVGLPLALLGMTTSDAVGVFELGTSAPGDIARLASILRPTLGVLTGIGPSHLGAFGSLEAIAEEKWSLVDALPAHGVAWVNAEDPLLAPRWGRASIRILPVGRRSGHLRGTATAKPALRVDTVNPPLRLHTRLLGKHNGINVLLAVACALHLGLSGRRIEERICSFAPMRHRLEPRPAPFGTVLDDTYNANPIAMRAALRTLVRYASHRSRTCFVYGSMHDLGEGSLDAHRRIAALVQRLPIDEVYPVGAEAIAACRQTPSERVMLVEPSRLADRLLQTLRGPSDVVLVKGSRGLELERVVDALTSTT